MATQSGEWLEIAATAIKIAIVRRSRRHLTTAEILSIEDKITQLVEDQTKSEPGVPEQC